MTDKQLTQLALLMKFLDQLGFDAPTVKRAADCWWATKAPTPEHMRLLTTPCDCGAGVLADCVANTCAKVQQRAAAMQPHNVDDVMQLVFRYGATCRDVDRSNTMTNRAANTQAAEAIRTHLRRLVERQPFEVRSLVSALQAAELALADIGDAEREAGDDIAWCERRAAAALPEVRAALRLPTSSNAGVSTSDGQPKQPKGTPIDGGRGSE